jgi:hypothetical protein
MQIWSRNMDDIRIFPLFYKFVKTMAKNCKKKKRIPNCLFLSLKLICFQNSDKELKKSKTKKKIAFPD